MTKHMHHQLELADETATLYVQGTLGYDDVSSLIRTCRAMPRRVRTLRLDLHGLGQLSAEATGTVRLLLEHWRQSRNGEFRLSTTHMVATLRDVAETRPFASSLPATWSMSPVNEALTGIYL
jgi:ABC-type transporter Mla MlaB component